MKDNEHARQQFYTEQANHWDNIARMDMPRTSVYYHQYLERIYRHIVSEGLNVIEVGCGKGDLLAALRPSRGVGVDLSAEMIEVARVRHPDLHFVVGSGESFGFGDSFDFVILSDLINNVWDVQELFRNISALCDDSTRIVINSYSRLWQLPLDIARRFGFASPGLPQNWLTVDDIKNLLFLKGFDTVRTFSEFIFPFKLPLLSIVLNKYVARIFPFRHLCLTNFVVARKTPNKAENDQKPRVSIIVAARNEAGNIADIFRRVPELGGETELIFVEGGSTDDTYGAINREIEKHPTIEAAVYRQTGKGKGDAVRLGFAKAKGDLLMILDADMTVPPENLQLFYDAIINGKGEFINGVRLVYPMEAEAMRFFNLVGNKFFSLAFSWLLGQKIKDTLCGTKVLSKQDYVKIAENRPYFGEFDPFGDFDLIFGAAKLNLKIVDLPIRYGDRLYGDTNISRWKHGFILLKMVIFAAAKIKFY